LLDCRHEYDDGVRRSVGLFRGSCRDLEDTAPGKAKGLDTGDNLSGVRLERSDKPLRWALPKVQCPDWRAKGKFADVMLAGNPARRYIASP